MARVPTKTKAFGEVPANTIIRWARQWMEVGPDRVARPLVPNEPTGRADRNGIGLGTAIDSHIQVRVMC